MKNTKIENDINKIEFYLEEFYRFFKDDATEYYQIWIARKINGEKLDGIAQKYHRDKSTISRILKRIEEFLENPEKAAHFCLRIEDLDWLWLTPNIIINALFRMDIEFRIFLQVAICLRCFGMYQIIPRTILLQINPKFERIPEREKFLTELKKQKMLIKTNGKFREVQVFLAIKDKKWNINFEFTPEFEDLVFDF